MEKLTRRNLLRTAGIGGMAAGVGLAAESLLAAPNPAQQHSPTGPLSLATVAFGAWKGDEGLDRTDPSFNPIEANHHSVAPNEVTIRAGGSVSYLISGFHQIIAYGNGTQPESIDTSNLVLATGPGAPPFPILIDDPNGRIYRGADPGGLPLDRVETIHFAHPGRYLVICGVIFHFANDGMYGFVRVLP